ncbi:hypothetical protein Pelo_14268 [Pelomyxa schiedti]|nr:hypothetical protein Pelo_14268 [Pelomyxa schiedti]
MMEVVVTNVLCSAWVPFFPRILEALQCSLWVLLHTPAMFPTAPKDVLTPMAAQFCACTEVLESHNKVLLTPNCPQIHATNQIEAKCPNFPCAGFKNHQGITTRI